MTGRLVITRTNPTNYAKSKWFFHRQAAIAAQTPQNKKKQTASEIQDDRPQLWKVN